MSNKHSIYKPSVRYNFQISNASHEFLHPCEHKMLENIVKIADQQIEITKFVKEHNGEITSNSTSSVDANDGKYVVKNTYKTHIVDEFPKFYVDHLQKGIYLQALSNGIDLCIKPYRTAMVELEQRFLDTPTYSLMCLYTELTRFEDLLHFLIQFIAGIRTQKLV